jgi:Putative prokaryotic signal transducing protein
MPKKGTARNGIMEEEKWEVAFTASGMTNANIVLGRLETEGIPAKLKYEAVGAIYAITIDGLGKVDILVPARDLPKAREVLAQTYNDGDMEWESR